MSGGIPLHRLAKLFITALISSVLFACGGNSDSGPSDTFTLIQSSKNTTNSHNEGKDCLGSTCHGQPTSPNQPKFTLAGTVYDNATGLTYPNVAADYFLDIQVEILEDGNVVRTIPVNNRGNFYTNAPIHWSTSVVTVQVKSLNGTNPMIPTLGSSIDGACNLCHDGSSIARIKAL